MNSKKKGYIIVILFALATLFLALFFIWLLFLDIKNNSQKLVSIKNDTVALEAQNSEIEDFKKNYDIYKPNLDIANALFASPQSPVDVIKFLERAAADSGVDLKISLTHDLTQGNGNILNFQLFASSDFSKILDFIQKIEHGHYLIQINNASMKNSDNQNAKKSLLSGNVDATLLINAFTK